MRQLQAGGSHTLSNPSSFPLQGALLFVDMSGFTPLSERLGAEGMLGVEALSRHLNDYFGPMVSSTSEQSGRGRCCKLVRSRSGFASNC